MGRYSTSVTLPRGVDHGLVGLPDAHSVPGVRVAALADETGRKNEAPELPRHASTTAS
jgi:hypothetical protein